MFRLIAVAAIIASLCTGDNPTKELSCPEGGSITKDNFCEETPGCANGEDRDTIFPHGPCIKVGDHPLDYHFYCGSKGEVVPLEAMCNGSVECTNGKDETHAFCPGSRVKRADECTPSCLNGATCTRDYKCRCVSGWGGARCEEPICRPGCGTGENRGTCVRPNTCRCNEGWRGRYCQIQALSHCTRISATTYRCRCGSGWMGQGCTTPLCLGRCQNGGTCIGPILCQCPPGWTRNLCQQAVCTPRCLNSGTCTEPNTCQCTSVWSGDHCQTPVCSPGCQNGGTCTDPNTCECASYWTGDQCETPVCSPGCQNGGTCTDPNTCECVSGWSGDQCETPVCSPACENGGTCTGPNTCETFLHGAGGDPHFLVNLPDNSNLCFSLQGEPGFAFNLVTSEIIVINAVFIDAPPRLQDWTTVIGEIGVRYLTKDKAVLKIHFNFKDKSIYVSGYGVLNAKRVSSVALKGEQLEVHSSNISHTWASTVFVSIEDELKFKVFFNHDNLDIVWSDGSSFNHSSHGILGQFFNKGTKIDKAKRQLVFPKRSPIPVILEDPKPEVHHKGQCWRPQTPGYQGEELLEGDYLEYVMDSVFATDFKYSMTSL